MIKIIGVIIIMAASGMTGIYFAEKLKMRKSELGTIAYLIDEIAVLIRYKAMPVFEIMANLKNNQMLGSLDFIGKLDDDENTSFRQAWENSVTQSQTALSDADKNLLKAFGSSLGTSDINGQLSTLELYKDSFKKLESDACESYEKKSRLYRTMGFLIGAFISIMLI